LKLLRRSLAFVLALVAVPLAVVVCATGTLLIFCCTCDQTFADWSGSYWAAVGKVFRSIRNQKQPLK
jgi:hypothetical protein